MEPAKFALQQEIPKLDFATLDLLPYGIIVVNAQGTVLYYNAREEEIAKRRSEDVIGKNFFIEIAPCAQVQEFYGRFHETIQSEGGVANFRFKFPFPERPRDVEISLTSFENKGELLCLISVSDVTEQSELREHLANAERLREAGEVAAGVAHNFNNLLTAIRGNAELLLRSLKEDDPARRRIERILQASDDGAQMVLRIRESARQQPETVSAASPVDVNEIVKDSVALTEDYARNATAERDTRVRFVTDLSENLLRARANAGELREVFVNLLRNSVDAISSEGVVTVRSRNASDGGELRVAVTDTGQGMSADVMGKLFRPLFTTKGERGTGLGLATCYAIMRRHGGNIEVESARGVGTTFTVVLPAGAAQK